MRFFEHVNEISCSVKDVRFMYNRGTVSSHITIPLLVEVML